MEIGYLMNVRDCVIELECLGKIVYSVLHLVISACLSRERGCCQIWNMARLL